MDNKEAKNQREKSPATQTATLAMGCFWSPEALFGQFKGVVSTRVGYAGGGTSKPTYSNMGDHSETIQVDFDPEVIRYEKLLETFWNNHNPVNINGFNGTMYDSIVLYHDEEQKKAVERVLQKRKAEGKGEPSTRVEELTRFYPAEERHQKYYLKRYKDAFDKVRALYSSVDEMHRSTLAARLNGIAKGYLNLRQVIEEIEGWSISSEERDELVQLLKQMKW